MKIFTNAAVKRLFLWITLIIAIALLLCELAVWLICGRLVFALIPLFLLLTGTALFVCFRYFQKQNALFENAAAQLRAYMDGETDARIACNEDGELYKLFHAVNTLATVLNAHTENEMRAKEFLQSTISDISHQLKTPLAALNIYNGLIQSEAQAAPAIGEFAALSEQELDRMEALVHSLLKIAKLDAGTIIMEISHQNVADIMDTLARSFSYRAKQEQKELLFEGADNIALLCDRAWLLEAISNLIKNALDHTQTGGVIRVSWKALPSMLQITVADNGSGIHPEDLHHIFKRFYRSRFSQDTHGVGLGLSLTKAIVEAHEGTITVDSHLEQGSSFTLFLQNCKV